MFSVPVEEQRWKIQRPSSKRPRLSPRISAGCFRTTCDELNGSANKRLAFFAFLFGGISGLSIKEGLTPAQAHAVAMGVFCETLEISPMDSIRMAQFGIDAAADNSVWSDAAQKGMDEFFAWQTDPAGFAPTRLRGVLDRAPADVG